MKDNQRQFILNDSLYKVMRKLSLPAIVAMVLFGLNAFMDTIYIGQLLSETALAGVALAYPLTSVLIGIGSWAGTGAANALSIAIGNGDTKTQSGILSNSTIFGLLVTLIVTIPANIFAEPLIMMMGGHGEILREGVNYFQITMLAAPFWVYGLTLNMIIRGEGKMLEAATMMSYGLGLNLILTPIFMTYLDLGVEGAAWATNIGMVLYSLVGFFYFKRGKASFSSDILSLSFDKEIFNAIARLGLPGFILSVMSLLQAIVVFNAIVHNGTDRDIAFFAGANRYLYFLMTPLFGLMRALQPVIGINFGAGQFDRVKQSFILFAKTGFLIVAPFWLALTIFPEPCMQLVLPDFTFQEQDLLNLRIFVVVLPILPIVFMSLTFFPAINEAKYGSMVGMARQLLFYVPAMLILPRYFGVHWVYYGSALIDYILTAWILWLVIRLLNRLDKMKTSV